ncbi:MAG: efflux RND transporter periplasmic adaptor subunit, partial [Sulfurimicrobium sp.]|nr:efflux RND transporter periplasmic adaptor subunit [Sulfurimicrobium sp.]
MKARYLLLLASCAILPLSHGGEALAAGGAAVQVLRYSPGAPQLNYLRIQPVAEIPEPASEPLNGRIAYDENRTSRVSSPIAGRVVKLVAQPGDHVKAGQPLLWLDSPDLGSALADQRKADVDLHLKNLAYQRAKTLFEGEVLAKKDFESADADLKQSQAEASRAHARMKNLTSGSTAGLDGRFALRAPITGIVAERQANPGAEIRPDNPAPLYVIT